MSATSILQNAVQELQNKRKNDQKSVFFPIFILRKVFNNNTQLNYFAIQKSAHMGTKQKRIQKKVYCEIAIDITANNLH